jgi:methylenetetrahydrofolate dehydrogenase (NADP+) / methenyltetrahydrofolate cyclohydrolase
MNLIDGNLIASTIRKEIREEVDNLVKSGVRPPHLAVILVGHDGGSETYVRNKIKDCEEVGYRSTLVRYNDDIAENELLEKVQEINNDDEKDGLIVQLPLPSQISETRVIETISYIKDVDGFHPINLGRMMIGMPCFVSATPAGIMELIKRYKIKTEGMNCVVLGRSNIVGRPLSILLSLKKLPGNATVTVCHSRTKNLKEVCRNADILIAAMGQPDFITADMVGEGAVVIDVGTTRVPSAETKSGFRLKGDVKFDEVSAKCSYITPVPGGVGPMTRVSLLKNTLLAAKKEIYPGISF